MDAFEYAERTSKIQVEGEFEIRRITTEVVVVRRYKDGKEINE